jgi:DNA-binding XRE family transcriptional regulator
LRNERDRKSTQKGFAHEVGVSERKLRAIENADASVATEFAERIARAVNGPGEITIKVSVDHGQPREVVWS